MMLGRSIMRLSRPALIGSRVSAHSRRWASVCSKAVVETAENAPSAVEEVGDNKQSTAYPFAEIERKWQEFWEKNQTFRTPDEIDTSKPKYYVLDMFPYPRCDAEIEGPL